LERFGGTDKLGAKAVGLSLELTEEGREFPADIRTLRPMVGCLVKRAVSLSEGENSGTVEQGNRERKGRSVNDKTTPLAVLRQLVQDFVVAREWTQYHTPKNLAMSLAIEAAEVMEIFQWLTPEESWRVGEDPELRQALCDELADVLAYLLALSHHTGIDLASALEQKMQKNERKYPVEEFRGRYGPRDRKPKDGLGKKDHSGSVPSGISQEGDANPPAGIAEG